jgi:hypothetical protein
MINSQVPRELRVSELGELALQCLASSASGCVLASFSQALYLLVDPGELLWLAGTAAPMHGRCIRVNAPLPSLQAGTAFHVSGSAVFFEELVLETAAAAPWYAPLPDFSRAAPIAGLAARIHDLIEGLDLSLARGLGTFIPDILQLAGLSCSFKASPPTDPLLALLRPRVMDAVSACFTDKEPDTLRLAGSLIGLGPGLTPSGDDFLGGFLFCLHGLNSLYGDPQFSYQDPPLAQFATRTHPISFSLLRDLAGGHAIAPLHELFNSLVWGSPREHTALSASQLLRLGHSTGWDMLTGLLTGLLVSIPARAESFALAAPLFEV